MPESMLLKILDTFYLRAKACILCFDMVILIGGRGCFGVVVVVDVGADLFLVRSLHQSSRFFLVHSQSLPVSGNTAILNGFSVLHLQPSYPLATPTLLPFLASPPTLLSLELPLFFDFSPH